MMRCSSCRYLRKRDKLAWCAGFFDGEGWVGIRSSGKNRAAKYLILRVPQKDKRVLLRMRKWLGIKGTLSLSKHEGKSEHFGGPIWNWQVTRSAEVFRIYEMLAVFLGPVKIKQFTKAINAWLKEKKQRGSLYAN